MKEGLELKKTVSNEEKRESFAFNYKRLDLAINHKFYFEALVIEYAIIEDRLVSFLHYCGIVSRDNEDLKINKPIYPYIRLLLGKENNATIKVKDISVKMEIVRKLLSLDEAAAQELDKKYLTVHGEGSGRKRVVKGYLSELNKKLGKLDKVVVMSLIDDKLEPWRIERNQIIHGLMSKVVKSVESEKETIVDNGYKMARAFDDKLSRPMRSAGIRKKFNIQ